MRTLILTSPLMHGTDVTTLQRDLRRLGYSPGTVDGRYGKKTHDAVAAFQTKHHLHVDGIAGPATWAAILAANKPALPAPAHPTERAHKPSPGLLSLELACGFIGIKEHPAGSNHTQFGVWAGCDKCPWCNIFVSYCTKVGAGITICHGFHGPGVIPKGCAYVPTTEAWLKAEGLWLPRTHAVEDGLIVPFNWDGGVPDHIGFSATEATLRRLVPNRFKEAYEMFGPLHHGEFWTVEGNTGVGNDSNGGEVMIRQRSTNLIDGFGKLAA